MSNAGSRLSEIPLAWASSLLAQKLSESPGRPFGQKLRRAPCFISPRREMCIRDSCVLYVSVHKSLGSLGETFGVALQWSGRNSMAPVSGCSWWCPIGITRIEQLRVEQRYPPQVQASAESDRVVHIRMSRVES
ncbi:hypothetical protein DEO72_LG2g2434 [Vigna unguiculata]|uniref:Uncharacterized protein n=1 Tax=Vigna unguiculata TaxID=3917 RepID=A0A4D6L0T4_VIGUN|nr:hypothetical protein DEO72_LG2g2434 [Vigna unguiculata]